MDDEFGFSSQQRQAIFLFFVESILVLGPTQSSVYWVIGSFSPGVKQQECKADHSPPSSTKVKNGGAPLCVFMA
jgi:hypothetical protein